MIEGSVTTGLTSGVLVSLASAPPVGQTVTISLVPNDNTVALASDPSNTNTTFATVSAPGANPGVYTLAFTSLNWNVPVLLNVSAFWQQVAKGLIIVCAVAAYVPRKVRKAL